MVTNDADDLILFSDVRVVRSVASALLCRVAGRTIWLPRGHISGKLWCAGDRGKLFIRRWVARDRHLIDRHGTQIVAPVASLVRRSPGAALHLVRTGIA
jgi:hypothetical protein